MQLDQDSLSVGTAQRPEYVNWLREVEEEAFWWGKQPMQWLQWVQMNMSFQNNKRPGDPGPI